MNQDRKTPIAIVGIGSISALGHERASVSLAYRRAEPCLVVRQFASGPAPVGALAEQAAAELERFLQVHPRYQMLDRTVQLAIYAAHQAVAAAGWTQDQQLGVVIGSSRGATGLFEQYHRQFLSSPEHHTPALTSPTTTLGNLSTWVAQHLGTLGPATELSSTCSTSLCALGMAVAWLRAGMGKRFLVGGTEAPLTDFTLAQMRALRIYSRDLDVRYPCRPCATGSGRTNTMVLGEGACLLALEHGLDHGRKALGLVLGVGFAVEPISTATSLSEQGVGLRLAMERALLDAGLDRVDLVVTHTPGTTLGDRAELEALRALFGPELPVLTSNKWLLGHTLGASGAFSVEYALEILLGQHWAEYPYPVGFSNRPRPVRTVLVNSVGFGGNASSAVLGLP